MIVKPFLLRKLNHFLKLTQRSSEDPMDQRCGSPFSLWGSLLPWMKRETMALHSMAEDISAMALIFLPRRLLMPPTISPEKAP